MQTESEPEGFGLKQSTIEQIIGLFSGCPRIERAVIYGSRAKGNYKDGSDIDLALMGADLTELDLLKIETRLDELSLPYTVDICNFNAIHNPDLTEHIKRVGKLFYIRTPGR